MIAHTQTILAGRDDGVYGNCMQTAVAAVLDLPIEAVPHFVQFESWRAALRLWANGADLTVDHYFGPTLNDRPHDAVLIAAGRSPRGTDVTHVVLWSGDAMVHDVHPDRTGIVGEPTEFYHIWRATPEPNVVRPGGYS